MFDYTYLSQNKSFTTDCSETLINNNELILGATGSGKTTSIVEPKLLHAAYSSYIIPLAKRKLLKQYAPFLKNKGFEVYDLNFANGFDSDIGFDIFDYLDSEDDYKWFAKQLIDKVSNEEFWNISAESVLVAEMCFLRYRIEEFCLDDLIRFHKHIQLNASGPTLKTSIDDIMRQAMEEHPDSLGLLNWNIIQSNAPKTAACIFSTVTSCLDNFSNDSILELSKMNRHFDISRLNRIKSILFITTSPTDNSTCKFIDIVYSLLFKELFKEASKNLNNTLLTPVHIICDDFACGGTIPNFDRYISIFRAYGISVTILLQDETQLKNMYGSYAASTIINNCDTIVYTGGMDLTTQSTMSQRTNTPMVEIQELPLDKVIVCRRGISSFIDTRYQTYNDELYKNVLALSKDNEHISFAL